MPDFGRNSRDDDPSLDAIVRSDQFIDALASGRPAAPQDRAEATLASMLGEWRDEMRWPPATGLITERDAVTALRSGLMEKQKHPAVRSRRGLSIVGALAAGVLAIGGFGAVVSGAGPGDALYGLRTMLFGEPQQVRDDRVVLAAKTELNKVQDLIAQGDWQQAQAKLVAVNSQVESLGDEQQKQQLLDQWNELSAKVVEKDPEATVPPGVTYTVPPGETTITPAAVTPEPEPTTVPTAPESPSPTTDGSETASPTPSESPTTEPSSPTEQPPGTTTTVPTTTQVPSTTTTSSAPAATSATTTVGTTPTSTTATTTVAPPPTTSGAAALAPRSVAPSAPASASASSPAPISTVPTPAATVPSTVVQAPGTPPQIVATTTMPQPQTGGDQSGAN